MMLWIIFVSFLSIFETANSETHTLRYIYTAMSKPEEGFPEFTAMGLLDDMQIDYYDSVNQKKESKQTWMKENMAPDYWEKGTKSRKSKEQWFKVNVRILENRFNETKRPHVLQWMHGCTLDEDNNKKVQGYDQYSYDGNDFLSFDKNHLQWVAPMQPAVATKLKWDGEKILNQYTKGYLENECIDWLKKFLGYGERDIHRSVKPAVTVFAKPGKNKESLTLTCMATGFYPKTIHIHWNKDKQRVGEEMNSTWALPNNDNTFQLRSSLEIDPVEGKGYSCVVLHGSLREPLFTHWDGVVPGEVTSIGIILGVSIVLVVVAVVAVVVSVAVFIYKRRSGNAGPRRNIVSLVAPISNVAQPAAQSLLASAVDVPVDSNTQTLLANAQPLLANENPQRRGSDSGHSDSGHSNSSESNNSNSSDSVKSSDSGVPVETRSPV
ncbi:major histocompatibility complex class I-related gene protein-like isoform X3 [Acipenser ruthenus]|uniref:major histocompatibility complex class I-related gene protein-like isoform X3 n=1 Tax=Acipenser ruthenus TaxID=7906 RepID=UPI0027404D16|nr:major histocompatibility complex class I-related gene protein-like isoform X3 [Acipenser ruthenus]